MNIKGQPISFITTDGFTLRGLWFGPARPRRVLIFLHGLGGSLFGELGVLLPLVDRQTALFSFNNRGHSKVMVLRKKVGRMIIRRLAGEAHEVFTDCVHDIQGAINFSRRRGAPKIILVGSSTGCQKAVYYLGTTSNQRPVRRAVLLSPISDYASALYFEGPVRLKKLENIARQLVRGGKKHELMPAKLWSHLHDAQRFLSLYTPDSAEEIFTYAQPAKTPRRLHRVSVPLLVVLAEKDEFSDRSAKQLATWFTKQLPSRDTVAIIKRAPHDFHGQERSTVRTIQRWLKKIN